jgi:hypothetical protein
MTFASQSMHVDRFISEYEMKRPDTIAHLKASVYDSEALNLAQTKNVDMKILFPKEQLNR